MKAITLDAAKDLIGKECGVSEWITVEQERINQFADVSENG